MQHCKALFFRMLRWTSPLLLALAFSGIMHIGFVRNFPEIITPARVIVFYGGYTLLLVYLERTYHGLSVGLIRVSEVIYSQILAAFITNAAAYLIVTLYTHSGIVFLYTLYAMIAQVVIITIWAFIANHIYFWRHPAMKTVIIYRTDADLRHIRMVRYFDDHFNVIKYIKDPADDEDEVIAQLADAEAVFVAGIDSSMRNQIAKYCIARNIKGYFVPKLGDIIMAGADYMSTFGEPIMQVSRTRSVTEYTALKRIVDIIVSAIGIIVSSPIMIATAIAIKLDDGGPVFYKQKRLTQNARIYSILKFRSMNVNAEKDGVARLASENDNRITKVGKFIRATRIDELPQLFNILLGDMSLVGPRPERPEIAREYEKDIPEFALRLQVKAGLTGVAQVYGRYNTEPYSKLQMDLM